MLHGHKDFNEFERTIIINHWEASNIAMLVKRPVILLTTVMVSIWGLAFLYMATDPAISELESLQMKARLKRIKRVKVERVSETSDESKSRKHFGGNVVSFIEGGMLLDKSSIMERRREMFRKFDKMHEKENLRSRRKKMLEKLDRLHGDRPNDMNTATVNDTSVIERTRQDEENVGIEDIRNGAKFKEERERYLSNLDNQTREMERHIVRLNLDKSKKAGQQLTGKIKFVPKTASNKSHKEGRMQEIKIEGQEQSSDQYKYDKKGNEKKLKESSNDMISSSKNVEGRKEVKDSKQIEADKNHSYDDQKAGKGNKFSIRKDKMNENRNEDINNMNDSENKEEQQEENNSATAESADLKGREDSVENAEDSKGNYWDSNNENKILGDEGSQIQKEIHDNDEKDGKKGTTDSKDSVNTKVSKDKKGTIGGKGRADNKGSIEHKDSKDSKDSKGSKDSKDSIYKKGRRKVVESRFHVTDREKEKGDTHSNGRKRNEKENREKTPKIIRNRLKGNSKTIIDKGDTKLRKKERMKNSESNNSKQESLSNKFSYMEKISKEIQNKNIDSGLPMKGTNEKKVGRNRQSKLDDKRIKHNRNRMKHHDPGKENRRRENFYGKAANSK